MFEICCESLGLICLFAWCCVCEWFAFNRLFNVDCVVRLPSLNWTFGTRLAFQGVPQSVVSIVVSDFPVSSL